MKSVISVLLLSICFASAKAKDSPSAPRNAVSGHETLKRDEHLLVSFSVHARVLVTKGNLSRMLDSKIQPLPIYPVKALNIGLVGESVISFTISEDGHSTAVHAEKSTNELFEQSSMDAVSQWVFAPPTYRGEPTQLLASVTFLFSIFDIE